MNEERAVLIERLTKMYPYRKEWFESRTTAQLIAMYNQPSKKHIGVSHSEEDIVDKSVRKYDDETGQWLIKTDGHGWEPESN